MGVEGFAAERTSCFVGIPPLCLAVALPELPARSSTLQVAYWSPTAGTRS